MTWPLCPGFLICDPWLAPEPRSRSPCGRFCYHVAGRGGPGVSAPFVGCGGCFGLQDGSPGTVLGDQGLPSSPLSFPTSRGTKESLGFDCRSCLTVDAACPVLPSRPKCGREKSVCPVLLPHLRQPSPASSVSVHCWVTAVFPMTGPSDGFSLVFHLPGFFSF